VPQHAAVAGGAVLSVAAIIHLGRPLPVGSSALPAALAAASAARHGPRRRSARGRTDGCLRGLAGGGVYRAVVVTNDAVRSYRTVSPLPGPDREGRARRRSVLCGTFPRIAPGRR